MTSAAAAGYEVAAPSLTVGIADAIASLRAGGVAVEDMYGTAGAGFYDLFTSVDSDEVKAVLRCLQGARGPVADLAAGTGRFTIPLAARGHPVYAVDLSEPMLAICREKLAAAPSSIRARVQVVSGDLRDLGWLPDGLAAAVVSAGSISLLTRHDRRRLLRVVADALAPGGRLLVSVFTIDVTRAEALGLCQLLTLPHEGFVATLVDEVDPTTSVRTICLLPHVHAGRPCGAVAFRSQVHLVDAEEVVDDAAQAGLTLRSNVPLNRPERGRAAHLLQLEKRGAA